ncbi:site-specific integrase [Nitrosococcus wardiae]|uniref:site-specific integrase n=1 Tax=Nitrosococcus wardiae TaxID=1814290 RepID=UPI00141B9A6C|nr:site-specific integrase [Nitrosococcus wardiae]
MHPRPYEVRDTEFKGFILRVEPGGTMTYFYTYRFQGKRNRYKIGRHPEITPVQARDVAHLLAAKIAQGINPQEEKKQACIERNRESVRTLRGFLKKRYEPWVLSERKRGHETVARIRCQFADLLDRPISEISAWSIEKWRAEQLKRGKKPITANRDIAALKAALSKAMEWDLIKVNPIARVKPSRIDNKTTVRYLTQDEEARLREALIERESRLRAERISANAWRRQRGYKEYPDLSGCAFADYLRPMVLLAINTGMRRGELFHLSWSNVNFHTRMLTVDGEKAKSGHTRHIPMNQEALEVLQSWQAQTTDNGLVFPAKNGSPFNNIRKSWAAVLQSAGINHFRFHDLRHHFASKLVMAGVDLNTVRELLGHADLTMTLRYAHLAPEHKAEAVSRLVQR